MKILKKVDFNLDRTSQSSDGKYVWRNGLIFKAGDYQDKNFKVTPEELLDAVNKFQPVALDIEHVESPFDGKLGMLEHIEVGSDGYSLYGTAKLPKWLNDEIYADRPIKVSCTWNRNNKSLEKLALVNNPRVSDAALMAAFSKSRLDEGEDETAVVKDIVTWFTDKRDYNRTWEGSGTMQELHSITCRAGAVCKKEEEDDDKETFVSQKEATAIQKIHDIAVANGAKCAFLWKEESEAHYNGNNEGKVMKISDLFKKLQTVDPETEIEFDGKVEAEEVPATTSTFSKELDELKAEIAALKAEKEAAMSATPEVTPSVVEDVEKINLQKELNALKSEKIVRDAETFAKEMVAKNLAFPAEEKAIVTLFTQLVSDDTTNEAKVTFNSDGKAVEGSRVEAFKALFNLRQPHELTEDVLIGLSAGVLNDAEFVSDDAVKEAAEQAKLFAEARNKELTRKAAK